MKASAGDQIVLAATHVDGPTRAGEVIEVQGDQGAPPYLVRWDDGHVGTIYPGPGAVLRIGGHAPGADPAPASGALDALPASVGAALGRGPVGPGQAAHVREWSVRVSIFEAGDDTSATVVLLSDAATPLTARGSSHRAPADPQVPEIGDEVAVARALRHLADRLVASAVTDIEDLTGEAAVVRSS